MSLILSIVLAGSAAYGQKDSARTRVDSLPDRFFVLQKVNRDGETLPEMEIKEVNIVARKKSGSGYQAWRHDKLVYNVRKVYPYAVIARDRLEEVNSKLENIKDEKERKDYIKNVEKHLFHDYEGDLQEMTIAQGRILIKLIDRETQNTSYELIRQYRGKIKAAFWQGIARIFGTNLKEEYDPYGEDAVIELIVQQIESGQL